MLFFLVRILEFFFNRLSGVLKDNWLKLSNYLHPKVWFILFWPCIKVTSMVYESIGWFFFGKSHNASSISWLKFSLRLNLCTDHDVILVIYHPLLLSRLDLHYTNKNLKQIGENCCICILSWTFNNFMASF